MPKSNNKIQLMINGTEIPCPSAYSYVDAKSYFKDPKRSVTGVIKNLDSYATFFTPRLKFSFKYMPIEVYRLLMKLIKSFNEFIVTAYDPVEDTYVTHRMYFYPKEFPDIFSKNLETLAMLNEDFELVGTNADIDTYKLTYHNNIADNPLTAEMEFTYGGEINIGDYNHETSPDPKLWTRDGYKMIGWNTSADGSGVKYITNHTVTFTAATQLYAMWEEITSE